MWNFRPSALQQGGGYETMQCQTLVDHYRRDNQRAAAWSTTQQQQQQQQGGGSTKRARVNEGNLPHGIPSPTSRRLRTCQWNVHSFSNYVWYPSLDANYLRDGMELAQAVVQTLLEFQADILVLNEFGASSVCGSSGSSIAPEDVTEPSRKYVLQMLQAQGYHTIVAAQNCPFPTAIATKLPVEKSISFPLDMWRSCVAIKVRLTHDSSSDDDDHFVWVYGTHLEDSDKDGWRIRRNEMKCLLERVLDEGCNHPYSTINSSVMIIGDLNQQRQRDYTPDEWQLILANKAQRESPPTDGVDQLLKAFGLTCIWDTPPPGKNDKDGLDTNWAAPNNTNNSPNSNNHHPPPSTHWTGTIVDYTYYNHDRLQLKGVYVSPSGLSDHRPIVCDWDLLPKKQNNNDI